MILQFLSNAVRTVLPTSSRTSLLSITSTNIHRCAHSNRFQQERLPADVRKAVEKIKGPRPKHPISPYFRFVKQIRPQFMAGNPKLSYKDLRVTIAEKWKSMQADEKDVFSVSYKNDMDKYIREIQEYNSALTEDDIQRAQEELTKIEDKKQIKLIKERAQELNKPKRPSTPFFKFMHRKSDRQPGESSTGYVKRMTEKWHSLSETERSKYKITEKEKQNYRKAMLQWEAETNRNDG